MDGDKEFLHLSSGIVEREAGNLSGSIDAFNSAIQINSNSAVNYRELGKSLYEMHRFQSALDTLRKAETVMQRIDPEVYFYIAEILRRRLPTDPGLFKDVEEYYKLAIMNGKHRRSYISLAEIYSRENDFSKATELYESCILVSNKTTDILFKMGLAYMKMRENQRAFEKLLDVTYIDDQQKDSLLALGGILQSRNDADGALRKYRRISPDKIDSGELWSNIGLCFNQKRKLVASVASIRKGFAQSPLNYSIALNLGVVLIRSGQYATGFQVLAASVNLEPTNAICYTLLGICLACLGDPTNAEMAFEQSLMFVGASVADSKILLNAAIFWFSAKQLEKAALLLRKYMEVVEGTTVGSEETKAVQRLHRDLLASGN